MSVMKYKDPETGLWTAAPSVKVVSVVRYEGGSPVGVPADIVAEAERVANSIQSKMASNSLNFIALSDMHEMGDNDWAVESIIEQYRRANRNAGQGAKLVADRISPDFFANLGDLAWGSSSTTLHDWGQSIVAARGYTAGIEGNTEAFFTPGNHDVDYANGYHDPSLVVGMIDNYRYVDFDSKKVRVICLNTADTTDGTNGTERVSGEQLQWFANALDLSGKPDAAKWGIIVLSHHPVDWGEVTHAAECVQAYLNGGVYVYLNAEGDSFTYDFSGKNMAAFIANFHGHTHCFKVGNIKGTTALRVAIPNACFGRNNEYGAEGNTEFGETTTCNKSDNGTGKNTAFCVVSVDLDKKVIYADCFGAGYDRVISYGGEVITTYTVTNHLSNAVSSNGMASIAEGASYAATITPKSGYELNTIKVTMGGTDITSTAVSGGNISIANVTGNIVITVTAVAVETPPAYTNCVPASIDTTGAVYNGKGYQEGYRLNSSGTTSELAGAVNSGFIAYNGEVIRVYGTANGAVGNSGNYIVLYDAGFNMILVQAFNILEGYGATWSEQDGKYMLTITPNGLGNSASKNAFKSAAYIRCSFASCPGEDFVVTLNEPIE